MEILVNEFLSIVESLEKPINDKIIINKDHFKRLLEKNKFLTFSQKVKIYKDLNFIIYSDTSYTLPIKDKEINKMVRKVVINYNTYTTLKYLYDYEF